jgi:hypothetical protein
MRVNVSLNLYSQTVPDKVEFGRFVLIKLAAGSYFLAPNALPHPSLANAKLVVDALELAFTNAQGGGKANTQALKMAETNFDNMMVELSHYVEDRANTDPINAVSIIIAGGMNVKAKATKAIPAFAAKNEAISGTITVRIKAVKGAIYIIETSPDPVPPVTSYVWKQVAVSKKATVKITGLTAGKKIWVRYALVEKNVQSDFGDAMSIIVT